MLQLETTYFNRREYTSSPAPDIFPAKLRIATENHIYYLDIQDIVRIQSFSNYSKLYFSSGQTLIVSKVLGWFDELLTPRHFFRVHRTHLINLMYLKQYIPGAVAWVTMNNEDQIPVARRKRKPLQEKMMTLVYKIASRKTLN